MSYYILTASGKNFLTHRNVRYPEGHFVATVYICEVALEQNFWEHGIEVDNFTYALNEAVRAKFMRLATNAEALIYTLKSNHL